MLPPNQSSSRRRRVVRPAPATPLLCALVATAMSGCDMKPVLTEPPEPAAESFVVVRHADGGEESWWFAAAQLGLAAGGNRFWCSDWNDCWKKCPDPTD